MFSFNFVTYMSIMFLNRGKSIKQVQLFSSDVIFIFFLQKRINCVMDVMLGYGATFSKKKSRVKIVF